MVAIGNKINQMVIVGSYLPGMPVITDTPQATFTRTAARTNEGFHGTMPEKKELSGVMVKKGDQFGRLGATLIWNYGAAPGASTGAGKNLR